MDDYYLGSQTKYTNNSSLLCHTGKAMYIRTECLRLVGLGSLVWDLSDFIYELGLPCHYRPDIVNLLSCHHVSSLLIAYNYQSVSGSGIAHHNQNPRKKPKHIKYLGN